MVSNTAFFGPVWVSPFGCVPSWLLMKINPTLAEPRTSLKNFKNKIKPGCSRKKGFLRLDFQKLMSEYQLLNLFVSIWVDE